MIMLIISNNNTGYLIIDAAGLYKNSDAGHVIQLSVMTYFAMV